MIPDFRSEFDLAPGLIHLNNAGTAPVTIAARDAAVHVMNRHAREGVFAIPELYRDLEKAREKIAGFVGTSAERVAFVPNVSTGISMVAWGLPLQMGDGILTLDQEFPANVYAWRTVAKAKGLRIEVVQSREDLSVDWNDFLDRVRPGVKVVALSWVQYMAGTVAPLREIGEACRRVGAWLVVDGIQGLGVLPFDLSTSEVDVLCGGSHKWLCGPSGQGFVAFRESLYLEMSPVLEGARTYGGPEVRAIDGASPLASAARFEPGSATLVAAISLGESTEVLRRHGVDALSRVALSLASELRLFLRGKGYEILGGPSEESPLVCFRGGDQRAVASILAANRVACAPRSHGIRLSPHGFNTAAEVQAVASMIPDVGSRKAD